MGSKKPSSLSLTNRAFISRVKEMLNETLRVLAIISIYRVDIARVERERAFVENGGETADIGEGRPVVGRGPSDSEEQRDSAYLDESNSSGA